MDSASCFTHISALWEYNGANFNCANLFTHGLYYLQNGVNDEADGVLELRGQRKAYLYLCTLPFVYDTLRNKSIYQGESAGRTEMVPYGYLLSIGAQIWRKRYMESHRGTDPIITSLSDKDIYQTPGIDKVWIGKINSYGFYDGLVCCRNGNKEYYKYSDIVKTRDNKTLEDKLVEMFKDFAKDTFPIVKKCCELSVTKEVDGKKKNFSIGGSLWLNKIEKTLEPLCTNDLMSVMKFMRGEQAITADPTYKINNFTPNYVIAYYHGKQNNRVMAAFYTETTDVQDVFRKLFLGETALIYLPTKIKQSIPKNVLKRYYDGFERGIRYYLPDKDKVETPPVTGDNTPEDERDLKCELYMVLKNIWDKWVCGYYNRKDEYKGGRMFTVENFFRTNFIFIDSFYNNIYDTLKLNGDKLLARYNGSGNNQTKLGSTVVSHLGGVASDHQCMMFNFPDNINFSGLDADGKVTEDELVDHMNNMFKPLPSNSITKFEDHNKFTVIYTHSANKLDTNDRNKFTSDSFDIWSYDNGTEIVPTTFQSATEGPGATKVERLSPECRIAYKVPSFGVAYSRQDNSLWRNIDISMDSMSVTEQTIRMEADIAEKGSSEKHNICLYGQDLYSIYQVYSYLVKVEMLGNAQIQPLMYFQLMNIPMFRGTYMIIEVVHSVTPGHMTTTFTGMKMSKVQVPFTQTWFTTPKYEDFIQENKDMDESTDGEDVLTSNDDGTKIDLADNKLSKAIIESMGMTDGDNKRCDVFVKNVYKKYSDGHVVINGNLADTMFDNMVASSDWKTVKLRVAATKARNWKSLTHGTAHPRVGDVLFGYHDNNTTGKFQHVAIYLGLHSGGRYVAEGLSVSGTKILNKTNGIQIVRIENSRLGMNSDIISYFSQCGKQEVKQAEKQVNTTTLRPELDIKTVKITKEEEIEFGIIIMKSLIKDGFTLNGGTITLTPMQAAAIAGVWYQESRWNPQAVNSSSGAYGIAQWLGPRKGKNYIEYCNANDIKIPNEKLGAVNMKDIWEQINYAKWEFNRPYYKNTCRLWGTDPDWKNQWNYPCGNLLAFPNQNLDEDTLYDLVYRFTVGYEDGLAPSRDEFCVDKRFNYAYKAYNLWKEYMT